MTRSVALFPRAVVEFWLNADIKEVVRTREQRDNMTLAYSRHGVTDTVLKKYDAIAATCAPIAGEGTVDPSRDVDFDELVHELGGAHAFAHLPSFTLHSGTSRTVSDISRALRGELPTDALAIELAIIAVSWPAEPVAREQL